MKTLTTSIILSVMFLSAGAFAGSSHNAPVWLVPKAENVTVIMKNQAWPVAGQISVDPCNLSRCIGI
jgi:hypothetical protein